MVSCSRWVEMTEGLRFHVGLASAASAPTEFRLLNGMTTLRWVFCFSLMSMVTELTRYLYWVDCQALMICMTSATHRYDFCLSSLHWIQPFFSYRCFPYHGWPVSTNGSEHSADPAVSIRYDWAFFCYCASVDNQIFVITTTLRHLVSQCPSMCSSATSRVTATL